MKTKKIYIDFETTNTHPIVAQILEACFMFVENGEIIKSFKSKIIIPDEWNSFSEASKEALEFNNINNQNDLIKHNEDSEDWVYFWVKVQRYIEEFSKKEKITLTGWNNSGFDNVILKDYIGNINYKELFDYHTRDIMHNFRQLYERKLIKGLSLSRTHQELIKTIKKDKFHDSEVDCIATKDLDEWYEKNIKIEIRGVKIEKK